MRLHHYARVALRMAGLILLLGGVLALTYRDALHDALATHMESEAIKAIRKYARAMHDIDGVRLLRFEDTPSGERAEAYWTPLPDSRRMFIVADVSMFGDDAREFTALWNRVRLHTEYRAACYEPHHSISFYKSGKCVAEIVPCFMCANTSLPGLPFQPVVSFDVLPSESPDYVALRNRVEALVGAHTETATTVFQR